MHLILTSDKNAAKEAFKYVSDARDGGIAQNI